MSAGYLSAFDSPSVRPVSPATVAGAAVSRERQLAASSKAQLSASIVVVILSSLLGLATNVVLLTQGGDRASAEGAEWTPLSLRKTVQGTVAPFFDQVLPSLDGYVSQPPTAFIKLAYDVATNGGDCSVINSPASRTYDEHTGKSSFSSRDGRLRILRAGYYYIYAKVDAGRVEKSMEGLQAAIVVRRASEDGDDQLLTEAMVTLPSGGAASGRQASIFSARIAELAMDDEVHVQLRCVKRQSAELRCAPDACTTAFLGVHLLAGSRRRVADTAAAAASNPALRADGSPSDGSRGPPLAASEKTSAALPRRGDPADSAEATTTP